MDGDSFFFEITIGNREDSVKDELCNTIILFNKTVDKTFAES